MLDELKKLLGMDGQTVAPAPTVPTQPAIPQASTSAPVNMGDFPAQKDVPEMTNYATTAPVPVPVAPTHSPGSTGAMMQRLQTVEGAYEGDLAGASPEIQDQIKAGYEDKIPELEAQKAELMKRGEREEGPIIQSIQAEINKSHGVVNDAVVLNAERVSQLAETDPDVDKVVKSAAEIDPIELDNILTPEVKTKVQLAADAVAKAKGDGHSMKDAMKGATGFLGDLFNDPAIKRALIYYTGSRLMGYSGSGSGMAAGQVLLQGWKTQDAMGIKTADRNAKAAADNAKASTLDLSKTVTKFDPRTKQTVDVYQAPNGDTQIVGTGKTYAAQTTGFVDYKKGHHKTFEDMDNELIAGTDAMIASTLANIQKGSGDDGTTQYTTRGANRADELFADGNAQRELLLMTTRSMKDAGIDYGTPEFQSAYKATIQTYMRDVANGKYENGDQPAMADMVGMMTANWLKTDLKGEGSVPEFILGEKTWDGSNQYTKNFVLPQADALKLHKQSTLISNQLIDLAISNGHSPAKANALINKSKTLNKMGDIFKNKVMSDPVAKKFWMDKAEGRGTNSFNAWLNSAKLGEEAKYMGVSNPEIRKLLGTLYNSEFE